MDSGLHRGACCELAACVFTFYLLCEVMQVMRQPRAYHRVSLPDADRRGASDAVMLKKLLLPDAGLRIIAERTSGDPSGCEHHAAKTGNLPAVLPRTSSGCQLLLIRLRPQFMSRPFL
jgi:hypothetical protein